MEEVKANLGLRAIELLPFLRGLTPNSTGSAAHMAGGEQNVELADYKARLRLSVGRFAS